MQTVRSRQYAAGSEKLPRRVVFYCLLPIAYCLLLFGCDKPLGDSHITGHTSEQILGDFASLYRCVQDNVANHQPPSRIQELEKSKSGFPFGYKAAQNGEIVVMWGAPIGDGNSILAYERDTPVLGGWVLLQNGNVKQLSAPEFRTTPKAGK